MRVSIVIFAFLSCASLSVHGQTDSALLPAADDVIAKMYAHDGQREVTSGGYIGNRQYVLENHRFSKQAEMKVSIVCDADGTKHFQVIAEEGWKSADRRVLQKMLESESESSRPSERPKSRITSENYSFRMIGTVSLNGRPAFEIGVVPKRRDKQLFRGRIWVDTTDYALARVEGEPAKSPSFWIHSVHFTQEYRKSGAYWYPFSTTSVTDALIFGVTEVDIHYSDYKPRSPAEDEDASSVFAEVSYEKH